MSTPPTPTTVEPGQMWRDNDQRTKGSGEFVVLEVIDRYDPSTDKIVPDEAVVRREATGRKRVIRVDRLLKGSNTQRGYTYLGMSR